MRWKELHKTGENQQLKFKTSFGKETIESIAAFSNAYGGTILIGIDQNGKVKGIFVNEELLKEWVNMIKQATHPQIFPEINPVKFDGKSIVVIKVQEYPIKPVSCKGKYFKRVGASNHLIPVDEIVDLQLFSINSSFDSFPVKQILADLNRELIVKFFKQLENAVIHKDYRNPTDIMIKIFDDSIHFVNPGGLMGGLNSEDLLKGDYNAIHRNKLLAEVFYLRGDIEKFGTGFFRIQAELQNYPEIQFTIESLDGFTRSGLLEVSSQDAPQDTPQDTPQDELEENPTVKNLLRILIGEMTRQEIQKELKLQDRSYLRKSYLQPALKIGLIEMTLPNKPNSKYQKYRRTKKGIKMKQQLKT